MSLSPGSGNGAARLLPALPILLILILATLVLWPSPASLWNYWAEILDYQHGFVVAAIALAWIGRELWRGAAAGAQPSWKAALVLALVLCGWIIAARGGIAILHQLLWPLVLGSAVWSVAGWPVARRLIAPIGMLYAAIPVWDYGLPVLQRLSIFSTEQMLALLGVPAKVSEYRVTIPEGTFAIVEGCSGKRYFVVTLAIAYLAIAMNGLRGWRALLFLAVAGLMSMLVNWIRIFIVIYAGHVSNMQHYLVANEHKSLGNALFVVLIVAVLLLGRWSAGKGSRVTQGATADVPQRDSSAVRWQPLILLPAALLLLALPASLIRAAAAPLHLAALPIATGNWMGPLPPQAGWRPEFSEADDEQRVAYVSTAGTVELYANVYSDQRAARELIHYGNNVIAPVLWLESWDTPAGALQLSGGAWSIRQMQGPDQRTWLLTQAYRIKGHQFRSELAAKLAYGWLSLLGEAPSGVLAAASVCDARNCNNAHKLLTDFWDNMQLPMEAVIPAGAPPAQ